MEQRSFINEFISIGMDEYFGDKRSNLFERHVVECLCDIYGKDTIKSLYDEGKETEFTELIYSFGIPGRIYDNFLRDTVKYEKFKEENRLNPAVKSDIASSVESALITMFLYKCLLKEPTLEELGHFENNLLNNFAIIKMHFNSSLNPNKTRETWENKKKILLSNVELEEVKPEYLDEFTYARFGVSLEQVKQMDYRMVEELNTYIKSKTLEVSNEPKPKKKTIKGDLIISSGNGFVDALLIMGIIATEMSIGLIYLFLNM